MQGSCGAIYDRTFVICSKYERRQRQEFVQSALCWQEVAEINVYSVNRLLYGMTDESYIRRNEEEISFLCLIYALVYKGMEMCNVVIGQWLVTTFLSKS